MKLTLTTDPIFLPTTGEESFDYLLAQVLDDLVQRIHQDLRNILIANQGGQVTLIAGTLAVVFDNELSNTNYYVTFGSSTSGETFRWSSKATTGFTITSSVGGSTAVVDWHIHQKLE